MKRKIGLTRTLALAGAIMMASPCMVYATEPVNTNNEASAEDDAEEVHSLSDLPEITVYEENTEEEEDTHGFEYGKDGAYFRTQEEFEAYYKGIKDRLVEDPKNEGAFVELYHFVSVGGASQAQAMSILNDGYLREYVKEFKESGVLPEDYTVPNDGKTVKTVMTFDSEGASLYDASTIAHYFNDIDDTTIDAIAALLFDTDPSDAYVTISDYRNVNTKLPIGLITTSGYNRESLMIDFMDIDRGIVRHGWTFEHIIMTGTNADVDLAVGLTDDEVTFDLGMKLVQPVELHFYAGEANTDYNVTDLDTNEVQKITSNENGLVSIYDKDGKGHYKYEKVLQNAQKDDTQHATGVTKHENVDVSNAPNSLIIKIIVGALALIGAGLIVFGIKRK